MKILHFTTDLMLGSQVGQSARGRGMTVEMIHRMDRLFEQVDASTALIVIDLQCANWSAEQFALLRAEKPSTTPVVAYAQHVFPELLVEAKQAGIDTVMTRGQFTSSVGQLLQNLSSSEASNEAGSQE